MAIVIFRPPEWEQSRDDPLRIYCIPLPRVATLKLVPQS
jgi:hypothetical protein